MKATILIYVTGIEMDSHTEMASQCKTWASSLIHFFTLGKWVQLKHKLITEVVFSKGIATIVYKICLLFETMCDKELSATQIMYLLTYSK